MPCSAAALVTSGSFAAPSSIEYSVCTCRCTNESDDGVLTGVGAPHGSCVPGRRGPRRATGGEDRWGGARPTGPVPGWSRRRRVGTSILAPAEVYAGALTERVCDPADRSVTPADAAS